MRLLVVTNDYPPKAGGIQQYLGNVVAAYPDPVLVLAPEDRRAGREDQVKRGPASFMWPTARVGDWVVREAEAFRPDAVLFGAPHPLPVLGPRLRDRLGVPFGTLSHGAEITVPAAVPGLRRWLGKTLAAADVRFAVSRFTAAKVQRLAGAPVVLIGSGVDIEVFRPPQERGRNVVPVVGCVSRFVPRKGQQRLLEAAARLGTPVEVLLVGKGRNERRLRAQARRLGVATRFEVGVPWSELPDLYRHMDVFCMPCRSRWAGLEAEGLGIVFLEAAATGLPVLAGDSGGSPETVLPAETGYVVRSVADIVEALELLLGERSVRLQMGAAGRRFVEDRFTWQKVVAGIKDGFEAIG